MKATVDTLLAFLDRLSVRERRLLAVLTVLVCSSAFYALAIQPALASRASMELRIATLKRDMGAIEVLATRIDNIQQRLTQEQGAPEGDGSLFALVDRLTSTTVPPGSVESIVPNKGTGRRGTRKSSVDLRLGGISLAQLVKLLAGIEAQAGTLHVLHLDLKRQYENHSLFDATITVASGTEET